MKGMTRALSLISCLAVIASAVFTAPEGKPDSHFREQTLVSWLSALVLLAAGALLLGTARAREHASGHWLFWEAAGWGFIYLGFDEHFQFHERVGVLLERSLGRVSLVNHLDHAVIMAYGMVAATWCLIHRDQIRLLWSGWLPAGLASTCLLGTIAADAFSPDTPRFRALEESLKLLAGAGFLLWAWESHQNARQISRAST